MGESEEKETAEGEEEEEEESEEKAEDAEEGDEEEATEEAEEEAGAEAEEEADAEAKVEGDADAEDEADAEVEAEQEADAEAEEEPMKLLTQKRMVVMRNNTGIIDVKTKHSKTIHTSRTYFRAVCRDISYTLIIWNCVVSHTCVIPYDGRDLTTRITHNISKELTQLNYYACNFILIMKLHGVSS